MEKGIKIVNEYFKTDITIKSRKPRIVEARQIYFYCMSRNTDYSLNRLGKKLGTCHRNVIYGKEKIKDLMMFEKQLREDIGVLDYLIKEAYDEEMIKTRYETDLLIHFKEWIFDNYPSISIEGLSDLDIRKYALKINLCG